jgi:hypothetical protein
VARSRGVLETKVRDEDGKLFWSVVQSLDGKGKPVSMVERNLRDNDEFRYTYRFVSFDAKGNWIIKRTCLYERFISDRLDSTSEFTESRLLTYFR